MTADASSGAPPVSAWASARRAAASDPGVAHLWDYLGSFPLGARDYATCLRFARRSLSLNPHGWGPLFLRCLMAGAQADVASAMRFARCLMSLEPGRDEAFLCLVWDQNSLRNPAAMLANRQEAVFVWLMRSYAALGLRWFNAQASQDFRERLSPRLVERISQFIGHANTGPISRPVIGPRKRQYLIERGINAYIGELATTNDCLHKMMALGLLPPGELNYLVDGHTTANQVVLDLWPSTTRFVDRTTVSADKSDAFVKIDSAYLPFGKRFFLKWEVFAFVQRLWERQGRSSLVRSSEVDRLRRAYEALLAQIGWSQGDRVVCLHIREDIYDRGGVNNVTQRFRNSDPKKFLKSIGHLVDAGYKVLRIGATGSHVFPPVPDYFDYANSALKSPDVDVAIMGNASFYFGTDSGPASVAYIFGRPVCIVDFAQVALGLDSCQSLFSPRLFWSRRKNRLLTLQEMVRQPFRYLTTHHALEDEEISLVENTEDEVLLVLREFLERYQAGTFLDQASWKSRQRQAYRIFKRNRIMMNALVSERFLELHPGLLADQVLPGGALDRAPGPMVGAELVQ